MIDKSNYSDILNNKAPAQRFNLRLESDVCVGFRLLKKITYHYASVSKG
jgi:hypothetical protein